MVSIKNKEYEINTPVSAISLLQLIKYLRAISFDSNVILTPELDKAAAYHFGLLLKNPPLEYFTEQGIRGLSINELVSVFNELSAAANDNDALTITLDPKDAEIQKLKEQLALKTKE